MSDNDVKALTAGLSSLAIADTAATTTPATVISESKVGATAAAPLSLLTIGDAVKREKVTAERAAVLVQPLIAALANNTVYDKIELINLSFGLPAAEVLAAQLAKLPRRVRIVNFADIIAGQETSEALKVLNVLCTSIAGQPLEELNLSDNALGPAGIDAISPAVNDQKDLVRLYFNNNGLSAEATEKLPALVARAHGAVGRLTHLECYNNMMGDAGARAVAQMISHNAATLRHVRVATTRLSLKGGGGTALAKALCDVKELHHLDLSDNAIGVEAGHILVDGCLSRCGTLRSLILGDTGFDAAVLRKLFALPNLTTLEVLELNNFDLGSEVATEALAPFLARNRSLRKVNVEANELSNEGARAILSSLDGATQLTDINLIQNDLTSKKDLVSYITSWAARHAHIARHGIKLNSNKFSADGVTSLQSLAAKLDSLDDNEEEVGDGSDGDASDKDDD